MVDEKNPIPSPQPGDSDDVELALETAQRLHRTADYVEALKWLRRAVNAADEAGDDRRQLELARAAADYVGFSTAPTRNVDVISSVESVESRSPSRIPPAPQKPPSPPSTRISTAPATNTVASVPPPKPISPGSLPPQKERSQSVTPEAQTSTATGKSKSSESRIPPAPKAVVISSLTPQPGPISPSRPPMQGTEVASKTPLPGNIGAVRPPGPGTSSIAPEKGTAGSKVPSGGFLDVGSLPKGSQRVAVRVSARDENLYVVRPLAPGQRVPLGTREAWLIFDDVGSQESERVIQTR